MVSHLVEKYYDGDLVEAVRLSIGEISGHYAFCVIHGDHPDLIVGARKECPLLIGVGKGENFIASAIPAFLSETRDVMVIGDNEMVVVTPDERPDPRSGRCSRWTGK